MSVESRISAALIDWCGSSPTDPSAYLEDLWSGSAFAPLNPYYPHGVGLLLRALGREYSRPPAFRFSLSSFDFGRDGGHIFTVQQLIDEAAAFGEERTEPQRAESD